MPCGLKHQGSWGRGRPARERREMDPTRPGCGSRGHGTGGRGGSCGGTSGCRCGAAQGEGPAGPPRRLSGSPALASGYRCLKLGASRFPQSERSGAWKRFPVGTAISDGTKKTSPRGDWEGRLGETGRAPLGAQKGAGRRWSTVSRAEQKPSTSRRPVSMAGGRRQPGTGRWRSGETEDRLSRTHAECGGRKWRGSWRRGQGPGGFSKIRAGCVGSSPGRKSLGRRQALARPQARAGAAGLHRDPEEGGEGAPAQTRS